MSAAAILAFGAVSALGEGRGAVTAGEPEAPARVAIAPDEELARAGLLRPFAARVGGLRDGDRAGDLLQRALVGCMGELSVACPDWRRQRVGLVLGTSSGGMRAAESLFATLANGEPVLDKEAPTYFGPMARAARALAMPLDPSVLVLGACASATLAIGLATRFLARGTCDIVLAGGFDEVTVFVAAGFEALRATTAAPPPRPFRVGRDGMALGEGAAVVALAPADGRRARSFVLGFGASADAVHLTAPDREGVSLGRAATHALNEAGNPHIDLVSAHATATPFNDAAEFRALSRALGNARAGQVPVHSFKAQIGHCLGAGGALELLACVDAIERGVLPASAGSGALDPDALVRILDLAQASDPQTALKLTSAFGGANAALVIGNHRMTPSRARNTAYLHDAVHVAEAATIESIAARSGLPIDRVARGDGLVRLALSAVADLTARVGPLFGAGIVVGSAFSTIETNALFAKRLRERGATAAEPRLFPYTSPNASAGECSIAFGLTGPNFAVGGGLHSALEALACAALLVESGDADEMVVVAVDQVGPVTDALSSGVLASGAVALLLTASRTARGGLPPRKRIEEMSLARGIPGPPAEHSPVPERCLAGHLALLSLVRGETDDQAGSSRELVCAFPPDVFARVVLAAV